MRIGFTGAGGTGKSTTLALVRDGLGLPVLGSVTRRVWERRGLTEADQATMSDKDRFALQHEMFNERILAESEIGDSFVSDRTLLDHYAYCLFRNAFMVSDQYLLELEGMVEHNLAAYDAIFYFPITFTPPSDGLRQDGRAYNRCIDGLIKRFLDSRGFGFVNDPDDYRTLYTVPTGEPGYRAKWVLAQVELSKITRGLA